ncbi:MAG: NADPH:quinone oxidoreductase family protein [Reyranella sp.]|uniref:NADPH:quinone oxidoreductase family protein n=1 Tax=Reyranella sp. TaxID=1929291 RepID=UPI001210471D|nr:NADPH:quinone oxidoreductase family protein [Reyranella sp.]TAJ95629.1 MAG: NADPH:quinone oxidoreductase family protein [Reyranella sp.]TBR30432.1 MAG: NADPH:quinone oxidoreductase family protein [Reyranella sp.]
MRALVCHAYGPIDSLKVEEIPQPVPKAGEVLVKVRAAGVSFAAMLGVQGKHQNKPALPYVPGNELAGHVVALGDGVTTVAVGDRIATGVSQGAFAEYATATAANLVPIPEIMPYAEATNFPTLYPTAYGALKWKADMQPGEVLLVHGAGGGSGLTAIEVGKAMGAVVIASAGGADKLKAAQEAGADHLIGYRAEDLRTKVLEITGGRGADVIYDPVGGSAFDASLRCVAPEGRIIPMGFASGVIPQIPANILLVKNATVIGFYYGYWNGWGSKGTPSPKEAEALAKRRALVAAAQKDLTRWFTEGKLRATVAATYDLADWVKAFRLIEERTVVGKAVLVP